jgi:lipopolysaccharide transport system permease protein
MSVVPERWHLLLSLNPLVGIVEGFRWSLMGSEALTVEMVILTGVVSLLILVSGAFVFRNVERNFADVL